MTDAANQLGRDPTTVRAWLTRGLITGYTIGKNVILVNLEEVRKLSEKYPRSKGWAVDKKKKKA